MRKLEIYAVANASQWMAQKSGFPYIESICNNYDNVSCRAELSLAATHQKSTLSAEMPLPNR